MGHRSGQAEPTPASTEHTVPGETGQRGVMNTHSPDRGVKAGPVLQGHLAPGPHGAPLRAHPVTSSGPLSGLRVSELAPQTPDSELLCQPPVTSSILVILPQSLVCSSTSTPFQLSGQPPIPSSLLVGLLFSRLLVYLHAPSSSLDVLQYPGSLGNRLAPRACWSTSYVLPCAGPSPVSSGLLVNHLSPLAYRSAYYLLWVASPSAASCFVSLSLRFAD